MAIARCLAAFTFHMKPRRGGFAERAHARRPGGLPRASGGAQLARSAPQSLRVAASRATGITMAGGVRPASQLTRPGHLHCQFRTLHYPPARPPSAHRAAYPPFDTRKPGHTMSNLIRHGRTPRPWSARRSSRPTLRLESLEDRRTTAINVAVVGTGGLGDDSGFAATVTQLNDSTAFSFNATLVSAGQVDTVAELSAFNAVVIGSTGIGPPAVADPFDNAAFTSALRTWVEAGGGVVMSGPGVWG